MAFSPMALESHTLDLGYNRPWRLYETTFRLAYITPPVEFARFQAFSFEVLYVRFAHCRCMSFFFDERYWFIPVHLKVEVHSKIITVDRPKRGCMPSQVVRITTGDILLWSSRNKLTGAVSYLRR